jgi:hypothetical protein
MSNQASHKYLTAAGPAQTDADSDSLSEISAGFAQVTAALAQLRIFVGTDTWIV